MGNYASKPSEKYPETNAPVKSRFSLTRRFSKNYNKKSFKRRTTEEKDDSPIHGKKLRNEVDKIVKRFDENCDLKDGKSIPNLIGPIKVPEIFLIDDTKIEEHPNQTKNEMNRKPPKIHLEIPNENRGLTVGRPNNLILQRLVSLRETNLHKPEIRPINVSRDPVITLDNQFLGLLQKIYSKVKIIISKFLLFYFQGKIS